jgi:hypothetical protein
MSLERETRGDRSAEARRRARARLDEVAREVNDLKTPAAFADQLYVLREHVAAVRRHLDDEPDGAPASKPATAERGPELA